MRYRWLYTWNDERHAAPWEKSLEDVIADIVHYDLVSSYEDVYGTRQLAAVVDESGAQVSQEILDPLLAAEEERLSEHLRQVDARVQERTPRYFEWGDERWREG